MRIFILIIIIPFCSFSQNNVTKPTNNEKSSIIIEDIHLGFNNFMTNDNNIVSGTNYSLRSLNSVSLSLNTYMKTKFSLPLNYKTLFKDSKSGNSCYYTR